MVFDVIGPIDLDRQYGCTETTALQNAAYAAAAKLTDLTQYNRIFIAHPPLGSCAWGGVNSVGCRTFNLRPRVSSIVIKHGKQRVRGRRHSVAGSPRAFRKRKDQDHEDNRCTEAPRGVRGRVD